MNCKPGDLAVCIRSTKGKTSVDPLGHFCKVLSAAPADFKFRLPDGYLQRAFGVGYWVVEWNVEMPYPIVGGVRFTKFGICPDKALRPIRPQPDDAVDEMVERVGKPEGVTA